MKNNIFTQSENFKQEYSATIVKVGELKNIENSDNLKQVIIDGFSVVVNKNDVKEGDYMIYCKNETQLNHIFLSMNNMYELSERQMNSNYDEVESLMNENKTDEAKTKVGYFNKHGRVKMIRLRGCPSMGVLLRLENFIKWDPSLETVRLSDYVTYDENGNFIPFDFDTVNGKLFIKAYVPKTNANQCRNGGGNKRNKTLDRYDRMIPGEFSYHYDTQQLNSNIWKFNPQTSVYVSVKVHGRSAIFGNIQVKKNTLMNRFKDFMNKFYDKRIFKIDSKIERILKQSEHVDDAESKATISFDGIVDSVNSAILRDMFMDEISELEKKKTRWENLKFSKFNTTYDNIYSSRKVIKNQYINKKATNGFYNMDIWGEYNELLNGKIPQDVIIYGEIVGYLTGSEKMLQKDYDYGCESGTNKLMIYRVTEKQPDGTHKEYEIDEVIGFTNDLVKKYPEISGHIMPYPLLYHGKLSTLYHWVDEKMHWNENILEELKNDTDNFGMEKDEPLCKIKVPREGICLRIENDPVNECFKLKCVNFLMKESKLIDKGEVDIEMMDNYKTEEDI